MSAGARGRRMRGRRSRPYPHNPTEIVCSTNGFHPSGQSPSAWLHQSIASLGQQYPHPGLGIPGVSRSVECSLAPLPRMPPVLVQACNNGRKATKTFGDWSQMAGVCIVSQSLSPACWDFIAARPFGERPDLPARTCTELATIDNYIVQRALAGQSGACGPSKRVHSSW